MLFFSTLKRLMRIEKIDEDIRVRLRKTLAKFPHIEEIRVTEGLLGRLLQHRFSGVYSLVLNICRLIWDSTLPCKDKDGRLEFLDFTEDEFRMNCIFERLLMNFCKLNCRDEYLSYVMNQEDRSKPHTLNACGALVYPTVDEDFDFSYRYKETGHRIFVRTVNLGQPWRKIEERVKEIVKREGRDEW